MIGRLRVSGPSNALYVAYLDEFGHVGPFVSRSHAAHNTSPVFGLVGIVLPVEHVRAFASFFYQLKCNLLAFEIERAGVHGRTLWLGGEVTVF